MRIFLPLVLIISLPFSVTGQSTSFKQIQKKPEGTSQTGFTYKQANNPVILKSASSHQSSPFKVLNFSSFANDKIVIIRRENSPIYIEKNSNSLKSSSVGSPEENFFTFMNESKRITNIEKPEEHFRIIKTHTDELGIMHIKSLQYYKGIEIYGSESFLHIGRAKERFTGSLTSIQQDISVSPNVQISTGIQTVKSDLKTLTVLRELSAEEKKFLHYESPEYKLVMYKADTKDYALTWEITIRPNFIEEWKYFINAMDGSVIRKYNNTKSDGPLTATATDLNNISRTIDVYLEQGTYYLIDYAEAMYNSQTDEGVILTLNANNTSYADLNYTMVTSSNNEWTNKAAVSAHYNAQITYDYFRTTFNRNSINGLGGNIISMVNVAEDDGSSMENAFWNGQAIFYGNGGTSFEPLAGALDVAAHEIGHGVISNSANLEYLGQSGAMNEAFADIFGSMVDRDDWLIGEDVVKISHFPSGALRNMSDPHNGGDQGDAYWQPAHMSEIYLGDQDNGGVHINSGIINHAFYLFASSVGKDAAEKVFYRALTEYLTKTSQFIDLRIAVVQSASDFFESGSQEVISAGEAFDAVGIQEEAPIEVPNEYDVNPGEENLLIYNTDPAFTPTLYNKPASLSVFQPVSSVSMKGKVSVTDDGSLAAYVSSDSKLNVLSLDPENPLEEPLSDEEFFDNVAVSKDGKRIAAISIEVDTSIYVYDFISDVWHKFRLYNPTTSDEQTNAGGVLYADAIEFDHTGEYLIYDAYNELNSDISENISYWDVGFIKVWDNSTDNFGDGTIFKLFTTLPENVSIGNPVFSKNHPDIIAFDYFTNGMSEEYAIFGANLETGDVSVIAENTTLGYPSFSKNDDNIAFTRIEGIDVENVYTIDLEDDRISPSGSASLLVEYSRWPVYYATGIRELILPPVANFTADYKTGDATLVVKFFDLSGNNPDDWHWTFQGGTPTTSSQRNPQVSYNVPGTYRVRLEVSNNAGDNTLNREGYITVTGVTAVDNPSINPVSVYPNPVGEILYITGSENYSIRIFNQAGQLLMTENNSLEINVSSLSPGLYILEIDSESAKTRHKLLKQ